MAVRIGIKNLRTFRAEIARVVLDLDLASFDARGGVGIFGAE